VTHFVQQIMPIEADQSGHHVVEEADSKYWWLHRGELQIMRRCWCSLQPHILRMILRAHNMLSTKLMRLMPVKRPSIPPEKRIRPSNEH